MKTRIFCVYVDFLSTCLIYRNYSKSNEILQALQKRAKKQLKVSKKTETTEGDIEKPENGPAKQKNCED